MARYTVLVIAFSLAGCASHFGGPGTAYGAVIAGVSVKQK